MHNKHIRTQKLSNYMLKPEKTVKVRCLIEKTVKG